MGWVEEVPIDWIGREREPEKSWEELTGEETLWTTVLLERSVELEQVDPGARLRIACAEAIDRHGLGRRVDLLSFGDGPIQLWELPIPASAGPPAAVACRGLTDHTHVDLHKTLRSLSIWDDGPEFFVVLCSAHLHVDPALLYADHRDLEPHADPHWSVSAPTSPDLTTPVPSSYDADGFPYDADHNYLAPGGRTHACFVVGAVGGEPSPRLRHLAELSGGFALPIRHAAEADHFGAACRRQFGLVVASVEERFAEHDAWLDARKKGHPEGERDG